MHNESRADRSPVPAHIQCQTVTVTICPDDTDMGPAHTFTVPAYTVPGDELTPRVTTALFTYIALSQAAGQRLSLADFAMYLLGQASADPREQNAD